MPNNLIETTGLDKKYCKYLLFIDVEIEAWPYEFSAN